MIDLNNYKGIYFDDDNEKYSCPETGAHFKFEDLCRRIDRIRLKRGEPAVWYDEHGNMHIAGATSNKLPHTIDKVYSKP